MEGEHHTSSHAQLTYACMKVRAAHLLKLENALAFANIHNWACYMLKSSEIDESPRSELPVVKHSAIVRPATAEFFMVKVRPFSQELE